MAVGTWRIRNAGQQRRRQRQHADNQSAHLDILYVSDADHPDHTVQHVDRYNLGHLRKDYGQTNLPLCQGQN